jgi:hypothetical protein
MEGDGQDEREHGAEHGVAHQLFGRAVARKGCDGELEANTAPDPTTVVW